MALPTRPAAAPLACRPLNRNHARRDEILGTALVRYAGGIKPFSGLDASGLERLIAEAFIDPAARQNHSPTAAEFLRFMRRWPQTTAHGYAVSRRREDYRVSIEGIECRLAAVPACDADRLRAEFELFCRGADEYHATDDTLFAWWD